MTAQIPSALPMIAAFAEHVRERYTPGQAESFWGCAPLFRRLADPAFAGPMINHTLQLLSHDPGHAGDWSARQVVLVREPAWTLSLQLIDRPRRYIHSSPSHLLITPLSGLPLSGELYDLPAGYDNAVFDPALKLVAAGPVTLGAGEVLAIDADRQVGDFRIERPLMLLKLATAPVQTLEWLFSKATLHPWQANDADAAMTNLRVGAYVVGRLAHQSSLEPIKALSAHANQNVRWAAIQSLGRLSRAEAQKVLRAALDDPHPTVRHAAKLAMDEAEPPVWRS